MSAVMRNPESAPLAERPESNSILAVISRAASDPNVDLDKMERLLAMQERIVARQAEAQFSAALAEMQDELPSIGERGDAAGRYTYALWEDINAAIKPILKKHGFALSFRTDFANGIRIIGVLSHRGGHKETTDFVLPPDASGNKNAVQAIASSVSYGKRYTAGALLNLTSHGEDDDAYKAAVELVSEDQAATLTALAQDVQADVPKFLKYMAGLCKTGIARIEDIPAKAYADALTMLNKKRAAPKKENK